MDEKTRALVQESWAKVAPISETAATLFYDRLFETDPELKLLFKSPIPVQGKLLMKALDGAVSGLDDLDALVPVLSDLGARHAGYGVEDGDYDTVGGALLWTLGQGLGDEFTPEVKEAWTAVYGVVADVMKGAQAKVEIPGPITPREKRLVQGSFGLVEPIAPKAAEIFYTKLFEMDPSLKPLFKGNMEEQGKKLMQMLTVAVRGLDRLDDIVPAVQALGERHVKYGVKDEHYETVGGALLYTLEQGLGDVFTADVKAAWAKVYGILADTMKAAAASASASNESAPTKPSASSEGGLGGGIVALAVVAGGSLLAAFL